jgi:hypothetical protein
MKTSLIVRTFLATAAALMVMACTSGGGSAPAVSPITGQHPATWLTTHWSGYLQNPGSCTTCHGSAAVQPATAVPSGVTCFGCHHPQGPNHPDTWNLAVPTPDHGLAAMAPAGPAFDPTAPAPCTTIPPTATRPPATPATPPRRIPRNPGAPDWVSRPPSPGMTWSMSATLPSAPSAIPAEATAPSPPCPPPLPAPRPAVSTARSATTPASRAMSPMSHSPGSGPPRVSPISPGRCPTCCELRS